jgi:WhiB family transcriptional regulator, redox-sensing transcriptional regulator
MQWPDATVGVAGAAGFEAGSAGSGADPAAPVPRQQDGQAGGRTGGSGVQGGIDLPVSVDMPGSGMDLSGGMDLPCTDDPELFFAESPEDVERAKALCRGCQARLVCLAGALERREPWGVWGGELFLHGTVVPRKRPRGRPRKAEVAA